MPVASDADREQLWETVRTWRKGDPIPALLLVFPLPQRHEFADSCLPVGGDYVDDYLGREPNAELLEALIYDERTSDETLRMSLHIAVMTFGVGFLSRILGQAERTAPHVHARPRVSELWAALRWPCLWLRIARFDKARPYPVEDARATIHTLRDSLQLGRQWGPAQAIAATIMRSNPYGPGTHLSYAYDGTATTHYRSLFGFDLRKLEFAPIPAGHLEVIFAATGGTHVIETEQAIWLYHAMEYYPGRSGASKV